MPFGGLKKESDLLYFDGPLLSHFKDKENNNYLFYWVDFDENIIRWLVWKVKEKELALYLSGNSSLYELMKDKDWVFSVDIDEDVNFKNIQLVDLSQLPEDYLPTEQAFYLMEPEPAYESLVKKYKEDEYVNTLRKEAIYFILEPVGRKFQSTVPANEAGNFLRSISRSIEHFIEFEFFNQFKNNFSSNQSYKKALKRVKETLAPRLVDLEYSSFKVGINSDTLHDIQDNIQNYGEWKKNLIPKYKQDVIELDYNNDQAVEQIKEKYPEDYREKIYKPIYHYATSKEFKLSALDRKTGKRKDFSKVKISKIIPSKPKELKTLAMPKKKIIQGYFEISEHEDISKVPRNELKTGLLFQQEMDYAPVEIHEITDGKEVLKLSPPVMAKILLKKDGTYIIKESEEFNAFITANDRKEVIKRFKKLLYKVYQRGLNRANPSQKWHTINEKLEGKPSDEDMPS